jgi:hypothetical protein
VDSIFAAFSVCTDNVDCNVLLQRLKMLLGKPLGLLGTWKLEGLTLTPADLRSDMVANNCKQSSG